MKHLSRKCIAISLACMLVFSVCILPVRAESAVGTTIYGNTTEDMCFYERMVEMANGDLLATWCREFPVVTGWTGMTSYYFYKSSDNGATWAQISTLDPSSFGDLSRDKMGMHGLYVFPQALGEYPAGTILFATSDWNPNEENCIHIWRSTDNGVTWTKHSDLAPRGTSSASVWEPEFAVSSDGRLVCYYSDERQPGYDQCLALEISSDGGVTWSDYSIIVGTCDPNWVRGEDPSMWRPGMPRVTKLNNGLYFMAYENIAAGHGGKITCRTSTNGIDWGDPAVLGTVVTAEGATAYQCPAIACIDDGSTYGRLFVRGMNDSCSPSKCFTSTDGGQTWSLIDAPLTAVRNESVASGWSGTFLAKGSRLIELNNANNGSFNEIRCSSGILYGNQLIVSGADYKIVNVSNNLCLDDAGGSVEWGNEMILWSGNGLKTQSWHTKNITGEYFTLICNFSNLALDNPNGSLVVGKRMVQWDINYSAAQRWKFIPTGDGSYQIQNEYSGLYLDTEGQSTAEHAYVVQNQYSESNTQKWRIERIYEIGRFRSSNISDCHVYHDASNRVLIANSTTTMPLTSSQWRIVPGIADSSCISLESVDNPGYYLRHYEGNIIISVNDGTEIFKQDATWRIHDALDGLGGISLESYNIAGAYMRHYNSYLKISQISTALERSDSSFWLTTQ